MRYEKEDKSIIRWIPLFVIFLLVVLSFINYYQHNFEFLAYNCLSIILFVVLYMYQKKIRLPNTIILFLFIMILFNILGGNTKIDGVSLWEFKVGPIRYDNFVHTFDSFLLVFIAYNFIAPHIDGMIRRRHIFLVLLLILITIGLGSLWELVELAGVVFIKNTTVGDYMNNALDLLCNLIGAIIGSVSIIIHRRKKKEF